MVAVFGKVKKQKAPRAAGETAELRQMESLEVWAASLKAKQLADRREWSLEGLYWLAVLKGKAHTLAEDMVVNTDTIRVGYLVVRAQWPQARATRVRGQASLLHAARGRDAHHREPHGAAGGPALLARPGRPCGPPAEERARSSIKYYIGQQTHYSLEACCSDTSLIELLWR